MAYELRIDAGVSGAQSVEQLGAATDKLAERTRTIDSAIKSYAASNDKLSASHMRLATQETQLEILREKHRIQQEALAAAATRGVVAQDQFTGSLMRSGASGSDFGLLSAYFTRVVLQYVYQGYPLAFPREVIQLLVAHVEAGTMPATPLFECEHCGYCLPQTFTACPLCGGPVGPGAHSKRRTQSAAFN